MSTIIQELQAVKTAAQQQTQASQDLAQEVAGKMAAIDSKVDSAINRVEQDFDTKHDNLAVAAVDGFRRAVERNSGGKNTVIYDAQGNPNIMCVIPRFNYEDLGLTDLDLGEGTPTMFQTNGAPRGEVLIGKYLASSASGGSAVIGGVQPRVNVNYDVAKELCTRKGDGWHLFSAHEWAAIALWSLANETVPRGNTAYGQSHERKLETARRHDNGIPGDRSGTGRTDTGGGPATWSHDHTEFGIMDLVGNVWEWIDQLKLQDGRIITTLDNDPSIAEENWHKHNAFFDSTSASQEGTGSVGNVVLSNKVDNRNGPLGEDSNDYPSSDTTRIDNVSHASGYEPKEILRRLLIEFAGTGLIDGRVYARNYGERFPLRGGHWSLGSNAGLGALSVRHGRGYSLSLIGFRPAFFG